MQWLRTKHPARTLNCSYCGASGAFPNTLSFEYVDKEFLLFSCPECYSLLYDPQEPVPPMKPPYSESHMESLRQQYQYYLQTGCAVDFVMLGALSALASVPKDAWHKHVFVDIGAGLGLASHMMQRCFGLDTVTLESSYVGELGERLLGVHVHHASLEHLPDEVIASLQGRPCVLHINSAIADLTHPVSSLREVMSRASIAAITLIVPDASAIDRLANFSNCLPFLAPGQHLHLPSAEGMRRLFRSLGFDHSEVREIGGWLIAVGSANPVTLPAPEEVEKAKDLYLEQLMAHTTEDAAGGAAARLLPGAMVGQKEPLLTKLREYFARTLDRHELMAALKGEPSWDRIPFHLPSTGFWLAADAFGRGDLAAGFEWLDVVDVATERLERDYPSYAGSVMDYKWEASLYRAVFLAAERRFDAAESILQAIVDAEADLEGPPPEKLQRAREGLNKIREDRKQEELREARTGEVEQKSDEQLGQVSVAAFAHESREGSSQEGDEYEPEGALKDEQMHPLDDGAAHAAIIEDEAEAIREAPAFALDGGAVVTEDDFALFRIDPLSIRPERRPSPGQPASKPTPEPFKRKTSTTRWRTWLGGDDKQKKG